MSTISATRNDQPVSATRLPQFLESRMDDYYIERFQKLWGGDHLLHGRTPGENALHLSTNDYLCIAGERELTQAQANLLQHGPTDLLMSAVFLHGDSPQNVLEKRLAEWMGAEDGIISQSGWNANTGLIQSLACPSVPVYLDMLAHASLWEGALAAQARAIPFIHNDAVHLERQIQKHGPGVIAVDSVYSTNGSLCPVNEILDVAEKSGSILVVDESHSLGTHGPRGAGLVAELGLSDRIPFRTASLAKAFAGRAGFISCSTLFKGYFMAEARPAIFSSCLLRHELAWFNAALDFIAKADDRRTRLRQISQVMRSELAALGYNVSDGTEQIIALEAGPEPQTMVLRNAMQEYGIFGAVFCAPATPKNRSLMRLTLNSGLSDTDIGRVVDVCARIRDKVGLADWPSTKRLARKISSVK